MARQLLDLSLTQIDISALLPLTPEPGACRVCSRTTPPAQGNCSAIETCQNSSDQPDAVLALGKVSPQRQWRRERVVSLALTRRSRTLFLGNKLMLVKQWRWRNLNEASRQFNGKQHGDETLGSANTGDITMSAIHRALDISLTGPPSRRGG